MKIEEYKTLWNDMLNPDNVSKNILEIMDNLSIDLAKIDEQERTISEMTETINGLRDTNGKLVLRVTEQTEPPENEPEPEKTPEENLQDLIDTIRGE